MRYDVRNLLTHSKYPTRSRRRRIACERRLLAPLLKSHVNEISRREMHERTKCRVLNELIPHSPMGDSHGTSSSSSCSSVSEIMIQLQTVRESTDNEMTHSKHALTRVAVSSASLVVGARTYQLQATSVNAHETLRNDNRNGDSLHRRIVRDDYKIKFRADEVLKTKEEDTDC
jgi:hypothetical protein